MDNIGIKIPLNTSKPLTEEGATVQMQVALDKLIQVGALVGNIADILVDYDIHLDGDKYVTVIIKGDAYVDAAKFQIIGGEKVFSDFECSDDEMDYEAMRLGIDKLDLYEAENEGNVVKSFSQATIQERLRISKYDPRVAFRYMILDYKRYFAMKKSQIEADPKLMKQLKGLFLSDLMGMFNRILPSIIDGKQLTTLLGVSNISPDLTHSARELSILYKRALMNEKQTGAISPTNYKRLSAKYKEFVDVLLSKVFEGTKDTDKSGNVETKQHSKILSDGRISLFS